MKVASKTSFFHFDCRQFLKYLFQKTKSEEFIPDVPQIRIFRFPSVYMLHCGLKFARITHWLVIYMGTMAQIPTKLH